MSSDSRIWVIGTSCSGKTTFSRKLAEDLSLPCLELDGFYWGPGWTPREGFNADVAGEIAADRWVIEGNYRTVREMIMSRATRVIYLDLPFPQVFWRAVVRTLRRLITREPLFNGNVETVRGALLSTQGIPIWVIRTYRRRRREFNELRHDPRFTHVEFVRLRSSRAIVRYLVAPPE
jgi:adenylate kinase family enzyme